jgi:predicted permease
MLSNFLVCINAVIPLFILLVIGYFVRRTGLLKDEEVHRFNHMVFLVFFPPLMFQNLYGNNDGFLPDGKLLLFAVPFILCVILLSIPLVKKIEKNPRSQGAMIQAVYRSNFILMGLPVAINIFGKGNVSQTALLIAVIVPMYNVVSVIILESFRGSKPDIGQILKKVATNPIILGAVAGILAILLGITLPKPIATTVEWMADVTTPMALILLGASFDITTVKGQKRNLVFCILMRLLVVPAAGLSLAALLGFRGVEFVALIAMLATPMAVSSYTMADSMDSDGELAGNCVIFSTPLSCITLFFWLFLFKSLGMF